MKKFLTILTVAGIGFSSCQKDAVAPTVGPTQANPKTTSSVVASNPGNAANDTTRGYLRVELAKDAVNTDDILIEFNPAAKANYVSIEDAVYFQGLGQESLSSLSSNNVALSINSLPLLSQGTTIGLVVNAKSTGLYKLNLTAIHSIPTTIDIWLKDKFAKDSLDFRKYPSYAFNLNTSNADSHGSGRFSLVLRAH